MRISDWSSDVCSSDLGIAVRHDAVVDFLPLKYALEHLHDERGRNILELAVAGVERRHRALVRYELAKRRELVARSVYPQIGIAGPPIIVRPAYLLCAIPNGRIMREQPEKPRLPVRIAYRIRCGGKQAVGPDRKRT